MNWWQWSVVVLQAGFWLCLAASVFTTGLKAVAVEFARAIRQPLKETERESR